MRASHFDLLLKETNQNRKPAMAQKAVEKLAKETGKIVKKYYDNVRPGKKDIFGADPLEITGINEPIDPFEFLGISSLNTGHDQGIMYDRRESALKAYKDYIPSDTPWHEILLRDKILNSSEDGNALIFDRSTYDRSRDVFNPVGDSRFKTKSSK